MQTPNIALPYVAAGQAQKHVTVNEALARIDALVQLSVVDAELVAPPPDPAEGVRYIVPAGATGPWSGRAGAIALWGDGAWSFLLPGLGWRAYSLAQNALLVYRATGWQAIGGAASPSMLGVNATADATTRLAVASAASLFDQQGGDHRLKINKAAEGNTASVLFQQGYSGRAEVGLTGTGRLQLKASADGTLWKTVLDADAVSGRVSVLDAPTQPLHIATKGYVDAATQRPTFDAQLGANLIHAANAAWVKITGFSTVRVSTPGYDGTLSRFVAPADGNYLFVGQIVQSMGTTGGSTIGTFGKNGSPAGNWHIRSIAANAQDFMPLQAILTLASGDHVEVMFHANVNTTVLSGYTVFGGTRL